MGIHDGHRERIRDSFLEAGLKGKTDHQILEIILTYIVPRRDVNDLAHELINRFGSLAGVMDAEVADLVKFPYITKKGATLLKLFPAVFAPYQESKFKKRIPLKNAAAVKEYMMPIFAKETNEAFYVLCLDTHLCLIRLIRHSEGTTASANINVPSIVAEVLKSGASRYVLAHNHLSGNVTFSIADIETTEVIRKAFKYLNIEFLDHFLFSGANFASYKSFMGIEENAEI